jgi:multiple antibiotic resistance protein
VDIFLLVYAALFPVVNPPGSALVFLSLTQYATPESRKTLARRVAINSFFVMAVSLLSGAIILRIYGISLPVLRVAGGLIVAMAGIKLLNEGSEKTDVVADRNVDYSSMTFYPLTLPITTGPGTIAVIISLGLSRTGYSGDVPHLLFLFWALLATLAIAVTIYFCFAFADRLQRVLGPGGTDIAVRLSAFILFCIGVQITWTGVSDLVMTLGR